MNPSTTASLICPACGQAFLTMQQSLAGVAQCPHCAHSGSRAHFGTQAHVIGIAPGRRQVSQTQPLPQTAPPPPAQPNFAPPPAAWPGTQSATPFSAPTASIARATLQHSQALMPTGAPPPAHAREFTTPPHLRTSPWKYATFTLAFLALCAGALWQWWDHANASGSVAKSSPRPTPVTPAVAVTPPAAKSLQLKVEPPDMTAISADVKALVTELFAADTAERRAVCIHDAEKYRAEIEAMLGVNAAEKIELRLLARIPGLPKALPGGQPVPLFKLITSKCANGALIRLETGTDGKRRIHWPLLFETHEGRLDAFLKHSAADDAEWFYTGLRPSHGLDIPAALRAKYLTFDVQVAAGSDPHFVACVERDSPLGRFMDRESEWGKAYLSRLLVRRLDIQAAAPCLIVMDCEGTAEK